MLQFLAAADPRSSTFALLLLLFEFPPPGKGTEEEEGFGVGGKEKGPPISACASAAGLNREKSGGVGGWRDRRRRYENPFIEIASPSTLQKERLKGEEGEMAAPENEKRPLPEITKRRGAAAEGE